MSLLRERSAVRTSAGRAKRVPVSRPASVSDAKGECAEIARGGPPLPLSPGGETEDARTTPHTESGQSRGVARDDHLWKNCGKSSKSDPPSTRRWPGRRVRMFAKSHAAQRAGGTGVSACAAQTERSVPPGPHVVVWSPDQTTPPTVGFPKTAETYGAVHGPVGRPGHNRGCHHSAP